MIVPVVLLVLSLGGLAVALILPGMFDLLIVAGPSVAASLFLVLSGASGRKDDHRTQPRTAVPGKAAKFCPNRTGRKPRFSPFRALRLVKPRHILVDGSNVLYWKDGTPQIGALREVIGHLTARGYSPGVVFDANAGYLISGKYQHDGALGLLLGLPEDRMMVVGKGSPADTVLLQAARDLGARIVTNDRYRDWADAHPEVQEPGHLIRGGFRDTGLWINLDEK